MSAGTSLRNEPASREPAGGRLPGAWRARLAGTITGIVAVLVLGVAIVALLPHAAQGPAAGTPSAPPVAAADGAAAASPEAVDAAASPSASGSPSWERSVVDSAGLADRVGVRVKDVAVTGGGGLLDLRVQIIDADKADALHDDSDPPALVDSASGLVASSLLMGHSHSAAFTPGLTYYYIFDDPGNVIQRGGTVSVLLGNYQLDNVPVQ